MDFYANTPELLEELKKKLLVQCPPLDSTTTDDSFPTTSTTMSSSTTTTTTTCAIRCSMNSEFDKLMKKVQVQEETINDLQETVGRQDYRLVELEMMVREISSKP
jgi:hypothetical protein